MRVISEDQLRQAIQREISDFGASKRVTQPVKRRSGEREIRRSALTSLDHFSTAKLTVTVIATSTGTQLSSVESNSH